MAKKPQAEVVVELVRMFREVPEHPGGPTTAEVHPDEVDRFAAAGWRKD